MPQPIKVYSIEDFKPGDKLLRISFYSWQEGKTAIDEWTVTEVKPKSVYAMTPRYAKADRINISKIGQIDYGHVWCKKEDAEEIYKEYWNSEKIKAELRLESLKEEMQKINAKISEGYRPVNMY